MADAGQTNPYTPPLDLDSENRAHEASSRKQAIWWVRLSIMIGVLAPLYEFGRMQLSGIIHQSWKDDWGGGLYVAASIFIAAWIVVIFLAAWFLFYPVIRGISVMTHVLFGKPVSLERWHEATNRSLSRLPYCVAAAGLTWMIYSVGLNDLNYFRGSLSLVPIVLEVVLVFVFPAWFFLIFLSAWDKVIREEIIARDKLIREEKNAEDHPS